MRKIYYYFILLLLFSSCARTYHSVNPSIYNYDNRKQLTDEVNVSYFYDVQNHVQNKPYARKERKKDFKLVAIKIENNSDAVVTLNKEDFYIKTPSGRVIQIIDNATYTNAIRQYSETFILFYGLAGIGYYYQTDTYGGTTSGFTYNPIPLVIGIGNAVFATVSNSKQKKNLAKNLIFNKPIQPNSSLYGLIVIHEASYPELNFFHFTD